MACSEKMAKLTPSPSHVAPEGWGLPGQIRMLIPLCDRLSVTAASGVAVGTETQGAQSDHAAGPDHLGLPLTAAAHAGVGRVDEAGP